MASYGNYRSVNNLPNHYPEDLAAVGGYFDPKVRITLRLSRDGRFTIDGVDAFNSDGSPKLYMDLRLYRNNTLTGVRYVSNGLLEIDSDNRRYAMYINDVVEGKPMAYSVILNKKGTASNKYLNEFTLPSDHPLLRAFKSV